MSDTIPDVPVGTDVYVDLNTQSGIAVGIPMVLENKGTSPVRLQIALSQPATNSIAGSIMYPGPHSTSVKVVTVGENTVWAIALGNVPAVPLSIQENV